MLYFISYTLLNRETISPSPCYALGVDLSFSPHWFFHKPSTPMLYYYTTISAMRSILRNARIWGMFALGRRGMTALRRVWVGCSWVLNLDKQNASPVIVADKQNRFRHYLNYKRNLRTGAVACACSEWLAPWRPQGCVLTSGVRHAEWVRGGDL